MTTAESFRLGFEYGTAQNEELTPREIGARFPDADPDAFHNGFLDGRGGDRFRLDYRLAA